MESNIRPYRFKILRRMSIKVRNTVDLKFSVLLWNAILKVRKIEENFTYSISAY